ncbi:MAG: hypothetical protein ACM3ZA_09790, partial [Bacillota bacterium]
MDEKFLANTEAQHKDLSAAQVERYLDGLGTINAVLRDLSSVRIPDEIDHPFRLKSSTHSGRNRPPIPEQIDHPAGVLAEW